MSLPEGFAGLTDEQQEKLKGVKNKAELEAFFAESGLGGMLKDRAAAGAARVVELGDEDLEAVAGGGGGEWTWHIKDGTIAIFRCGHPIITAEQFNEYVQCTGGNNPCPVAPANKGQCLSCFYLNIEWDFSGVNP